MMPRQTLLHVHALYHMHQHNIKACWQHRVRVAKTPFRWHATHASAPSCVVVADEFQWRDATAFRVGAVNIRSLIEHNFQLDPDIIMALLLPIGSGLRLGLDVVSYRSSNSPSLLILMVKSFKLVQWSRRQPHVGASRRCFYRQVYIGIP